MADSPKTVSVKITNSGNGPRTFFRADGEPVMLRAGESFEGDVTEAEKRDFSSDLTGEALSSGTTANPFAFPSLEGLNRDQLLSIAQTEGYSALGDDASEDELRQAIEQAREANTTGLRSEMGKLQKLSAEKLRAAATDEGVAFETDDNKADLALKIAQARLAKGE